MLTTLLRIIPPDVLVHLIEKQPKSVLGALQKFSKYAKVGQSLSVTQQVFASEHLDELAAYFQSDIGKVRLAILNKEFTEFVIGTTDF